MGSLSDTINRRAGLSDQDGMHCTAVLFPCGISAQEVQNEPQSNSHACLGRRQTMETGETDENNFLTVSVFSSDLSLLVALVPEASERLALYQLTSVYCKCQRKTSRISVKWNKCP